MKELLPIGTVVSLKDNTNKFMITGFYPVEDEKNNKFYDYSACFYPEGNISSKGKISFNHDKIEKIYHYGYIDESEKLFKENLNKIYNETNH